MAGALLDAKARMGELFKAMPKQTAGRPSKIHCSTAKNLSKSAAVKELGFEPAQAHRFEVLAEHPELIEAVKAEAQPII